MRRRIYFLTAGLLAYPQLALAHTPYPGIRGFYVGVLHPLTSPSHVLLIIAMSLLLGNAGRESRTRNLSVLFVAVFTGLVMAFFLAELLPLVALILLLTAMIGITVIIARPLPRWYILTLTGLGGSLLALDSLPDPGPFLDVLITTFGSLAGIHYLILYGSLGVTVSLERWSTPVLPIAIRVAASWLVAISVMVMAFTISAGGSGPT